MMASWNLVVRKMMTRKPRTISPTLIGERLTEEPSVVEIFLLMRKTGVNIVMGEVNLAPS